MKTTTKILGIGAAAAAVALVGAYAFAQQGPGFVAGFGPGRMGMGPGMMRGMGPVMMGHGPMLGNFGDPAARLTSIKTDLGIKPEQTADWDAYAKVVTDTAALMRAQREQLNPEAIQKMEPKDREAFATTMQKQLQESQAKVKTAAEVLMAKLDTAQQTKARQTLPGLIAAGTGMPFGPGMRFGMMGGRGFGQGMGPPWMR